MENKIHIVEPQSDDELKNYYALRYEVLRKPWNQPESSTKDEWEKNSIHLMAVNEKSEVLAVGRLQKNSIVEGQIRSMAVKNDWQGKGLGSMIISCIEQKAMEIGLVEIILDARENAVSFYKKHNYQIIGDSYLLFGIIRHYRMIKKITQKGELKNKEK